MPIVAEYKRDDDQLFARESVLKGALRAWCAIIDPLIERRIKKK